MIKRPEMLDNIMRIVLDEMIKTEGYRRQVYKDSLGNLTVGIGHLVKPEEGLQLGDQITDDQVHSLFHKDVVPAINAAMDQAIDIGEFEEDFVLALTQVNFQLGTNWPAEWPNTYADLLAGKWDAVINAVSTSLWAKQTPVRTEAFMNALRQERLEQQEEEKETIMAETTAPVKSGVTTSEFWVAQITTLLIMVVTIANQLFGWGLDVGEIISMVLPNLIYILSRLGVKLFAGMSKDQVNKIIGDIVAKQVPAKPNTPPTVSD